MTEKSHPKNDWKFFIVFLVAGFVLTPIGFWSSGNYITLCVYCAFGQCLPCLIAGIACFGVVGLFVLKYYLEFRKEAKEEAKTSSAPSR